MTNHVTSEDDERSAREGDAANVAAGIVIALQQAGLIAVGNETRTMNIVFREAMRILAHTDVRQRHPRGLRP